MISFKTHLKVVAIFFAAIILFQGCTVYKSTTVSVDQAIETSLKVKIKDKDKTYKFNYLEEIEDTIYGTIFQYSKTAKLLANQITEKNEQKKLVKIHLKEEQLSEIYPKNVRLSKTLTKLPFVAVAVVAVFALVNEINNMCILCAPEPN